MSSVTLNEAQLVALVETYFAAVDRKDIAGTLACFDVRTRQWRSFTRPTAAGISSITFDARNKCFVASSYDGQLYAVNV